jgi:arsenite methyltransferase
VRARYGVDAPKLLRNFLLVGVGLLSLSTILDAALPASDWVRWVSGFLRVPALYALGMCILMLWESLVVKVRNCEAILDLTAWRGDEQVLDVGCGRGLMLVGAAQRLTTGRAVGIDLWLERDQSSNTAGAPLDNARIEGVLDKVEVRTADMRRLPFSDGSFDVVTSHWAVHNVESPADRLQALSEMVRVLRPGGCILLSDIEHRQEYLAALESLGLENVALVVPSRARDIFLATVSFGSFRPATLLGRVALSPA